MWVMIALVTNLTVVRLLMMVGLHLVVLLRIALLVIALIRIGHALLMVALGRFLSVYLHNVKMN